MEHLCSTPSSVHEKVGCGLGPSNRALSKSSQPSSAYLSALSLRNLPLWALILINMVKRPTLTLWWRTLMMRARGVLALPHPIRGHCHESFGVCENHNGLVVGEGVFKSQTCCRKFGPAGRAAASSSPNPAPPTSFGIVSVKACSHSGAAFRTVRGVDNPREIVHVHQA